MEMTNRIIMLQNIEKMVKEQQETDCGSGILPYTRFLQKEPSSFRVHNKRLSYGVL